MCVVSMIHDHYRPLIPERVYPYQPWSPSPPPLDEWLPTPKRATPKDPTLDDIEKLLRDFKDARAAAELVDRLTGQPDCVDPEKAKLEERVKALEDEIANLKKKSRRVRSRGRR